MGVEELRISDPLGSYHAFCYVTSARGAFGTWPTIDYEEQWPFDFAPLEARGKQGKRVAPRSSG
jgi:hypothetical protein